ncbi:hypothetical protein BaRGS_00033606 [Batillaria attramentaria]|uniref:Uncharacterized protein n=1 Tax=Batillaria attramentaria TaxID=370345 RepID=A0ABD0JJT1_9CAEN
MQASFIQTDLVVNPYSVTAQFTCDQCGSRVPRERAPRMIMVTYITPHFRLIRNFPSATVSVLLFRQVSVVGQYSSVCACDMRGGSQESLTLLAGLDGNH